MNDWPQCLRNCMKTQGDRLDNSLFEFFSASLLISKTKLNVEYLQATRNFDRLCEISFIWYLHNVSPYSLVVPREHRGGVFYFGWAWRRRHWVFTGRNRKGCFTSPVFRDFVIYFISSVVETVIYHNWLSLESLVQKA